MSEYHHGKLRETLLEEGLKLLKEEGYEHFSLRKLARRCQVSHNSPYRHFKDKEDLITHIARRGFEGFALSMEAELARAGETGRDRMTAIGIGYVTFFWENPDYLSLLFMSPDLMALSHKRDGDCWHDRSFQVYFETLSQARGERPDPGSVDTLRPWCLIHGFTALLVNRIISYPGAEKLEEMVADLVRQEGLSDRL